MLIAALLLLLLLALGVDLGSALSLPPTPAFKTASGKPVARYGLGGAARSEQPSTLPSLYVNELTRQSGADDAGAPFLFYYNPHRYPAFMSGIKELIISKDGPAREDLFIAGGGTE